jgi:DNA topoisomerase-3
LSISALARSRADWLYGLNLTRAYTLQGQKQGYNSVLSVGRVQTPILGLVVRREQAIVDFISKPFYQVLAHLCVHKEATGGDGNFVAKWQPSEACQQYCDEEGRVLVKALASNVVSRINDQPAIVDDIKIEQKQQNQPLPFNLSSLQIAAAKQFSMNAKLVLDVCQALYEKHKLVTYPRSDCRYLPKEQIKQASDIINMLASSDLPCREQAKNADNSIKSKAWNDAKITAHHAIIPTEKSANKINLNPFEKNIYLLIVRQYLAQFYPVHCYQQTKLSIQIAGGLFTTSNKAEQQKGWKVLFPSNDKANSAGEGPLPALTKGQLLHCIRGELIEKHTTPPESFTDATLLSAMTGIARFVSDDKIRKVLRDTDGLGTDATRAGIIDLLFKRNFLLRQGKKIVATDIGKALVNALPIKATLPDMTAQWESRLTAISEKRASYLSFMEPLINTITDMISEASKQPFVGLPKTEFKPKRAKGAKKKFNSKPAIKKAS